MSVIGKVRDNFRVKYGAAIHPYYDDAKILKSRFYKIIRLMVRRLQFLTNQVGGKYKPKTVNKDVPELVPLNDVKTKALLRSPYALDIRKKLAELYMDDQMNLEKASAIIKDLNAFFLDKNNGVFSNLKEKPLITNTL